MLNPDPQELIDNLMVMMAQANQTDRRWSEGVLRQSRDELVRLRGEVAQLQANAKSDLDLKLEVTRLTEENGLQREALTTALRVEDAWRERCIGVEAEVARLQSERDAAEHRLGSLSQDMDLTPGTTVLPVQIGDVQRFTSMRRWVGRVRAEVTAAKADALNQAADAIQALHPGDLKNSVIFLRARATALVAVRAADTRAELGDS